MLHFAVDWRGVIPKVYDPIKVVLGDEAVFH